MITRHQDLEVGGLIDHPGPFPSIKGSNCYGPLQELSGKIGLRHKKFINEIILHPKVNEGHEL